MVEGDCDDANAAIYPGAVEVCDGIDNDCDMQNDDVTMTVYQDADGDGYGNPTQASHGCPSAHLVKDSTDCNDASALVYPGALEACDGLDNDCDGKVDSGVDVYFLDQDGDDFGAGEDQACSPEPRYILARGDCDDTRADVYPGASELLGDGLDQDCGGSDGPQPHVGLNATSGSSIQAALEAAAPGDTVWVGPGTWLEHDVSYEGKSVALRSTHLASATVIDAQGLGRGLIFNSGEGPDALLDGFTVTRGEAEVGAGILLEDANPTLRGCVISGNGMTMLSEPGFGAGMALRRSDAQLTDMVIRANGLCLVSGFNSACNYQGGGLSLEDASPTLTHCTIANNSGVNTGGGVFMVDSAPTLEDCSITGNAVYSLTYQGAYGGGIALLRASPVLRGCTLEANRGGFLGGGSGMYLERSDPVLTGCTFRKNGLVESVRPANGGALYLVSSNPVVTGCQFVENFTYGFGGALYLKDSSPWLEDCTFEQNAAHIAKPDDYISSNFTGGQGGGLALDGSSPHLLHCTLTGNAAMYGGGLSLAGASSPVLEGCVLSNNRASSANGWVVFWPGTPTYPPSYMNHTTFLGAGGALYASSGTLTLYNSLLTGNTAAQAGGGMALYSATATLADSRVEGNLVGDTSCPADTDTVSYACVSTIRGGGLFFSGATATLDNVVIADNEARGLAADTWVPGEGGGLTISASSPRLSHVVLTGNVADRAGGIDVQESTSALTLTHAILAYNTPDNLANDSSIPGTVSLSWSDLFMPGGGSGTPFADLPSSCLTVEPGFLAYDEAGMPATAHLALTSPLVNAGDPAGEADADGSRPDLGAFGGPLGDGFDLDQDGWFDYFWPGSVTSVPSGHLATDWDADDRNASVH